MEDLEEDEKIEYVGKIRICWYRKVLFSDGLNYCEGKKFVKNISSFGESDEFENDSEFI